MVNRELSGDFRDICQALLKDEVDFDAETIELFMEVRLFFTIT